MMGLVDVEHMVPTQVGHDFARITVPLYEVSGKSQVNRKGPVLYFCFYTYNFTKKKREKEIMKSVLYRSICLEPR